MARSGHAPGTRPGALRVRGEPRGRRRPTARHVQFGERIRDVPVDGVLADAQPVGDGLVAQAARDQPEHFDFACRQAARIASRPRTWRAVQAAQTIAAPPRRATTRTARRAASALRSRALDFADRGVDPAEFLPARTPDSSTRARHFEGRAALLEQIDRIFELPPGDVEVSLGERNQPGRKACGREQAETCGRPRRCCASSSSAARAPSSVRAPGGRTERANQEFQRGGALGAVLRGQPPQMPLGELCGAS